MIIFCLCDCCHSHRNLYMSQNKSIIIRKSYEEVAESLSSCHCRSIHAKARRNYSKRQNVFYYSQSAKASCASPVIVSVMLFLTLTIKRRPGAVPLSPAVYPTKCEENGAPLDMFEP